MSSWESSCSQPRKSSSFGLLWQVTTASGDMVMRSILLPLKGVLRALLLLNALYLALNLGVAALKHSKTVEDKQWATKRMNAL